MLTDNKLLHIHTSLCLQREAWLLFIFNVDVAEKSQFLGHVYMT